MRAIQIRQTGSSEVVECVDLPLPRPAPNEVLIKIAAAGVNFADVQVREGRYPARLPLVLGHEGAGVIAEKGKDVSGFEVGDRVAYAYVLGSFAEYAVVPAGRLVRVPEYINDQIAAAATLQGMTAHYLSHDTFPLLKKHTALIHAAAGGVGLLLVQMAKEIGARVIATVSTGDKARLAREAGADEVIMYTRQDFEAETNRLTAGVGVDVVYDSVGKATFEKGLNVLRQRGCMVSYGTSSGAVPPFDLSLLRARSLFVTRAGLSNYTATREELERHATSVFDMVAAGTLKLRIERAYPLEEARLALSDLEGRKTSGKLLLLPN